MPTKRNGGTLPPLVAQAAMSITEETSPQFTPIELTLPMRRSAASTPWRALQLAVPCLYSCGPKTPRCEWEFGPAATSPLATNAHARECQRRK